MALHKSLAIGDIHVPYQWSYADAAVRTGATGFVSGDLGKFARQLDDNSIWMLTAITPTWVQVSAIGGVAAHKTTHISGGSDAFTSSDLLEAVVKRLRESAGPTDLTVGSVADGEYLRRSGTAVVGFAIRIGTQAANANSESESSTTSQSWQEKLKLTSASVPAGTYRVAWYCEIKCSSISDDVVVRVQQDDTTNLAENNIECKDPTNYIPLSGFAYVTLTAAVHTFDIDYYSESAGVTAYIRRARIEMWRIG